MTRTVVALFAVAALGAASAAAAPRQDRVNFPSLDADLTGGPPTDVSAILLEPAGAGPFPAIVLLHGCGGLFNRRGRLTSRHDWWAREFRRLGYVVLMPDSFGSRGHGALCKRRKRPVKARRERPRDAYGALRYLQARGDVDPDRIGVLGWSNGGMTVLTAIDLAATWRPETGRSPDFRAAVSFYPGCRYLRRRGTWSPAVRLLVLVGLKDDWTAPKPCIDLVTRAESRGADVEIVAYPGAHHGFDAPNQPVRVRKGISTTRSGTATVGTDPKAREDAIRRVTTFFARHLDGEDRP